MRSVPRRFTRKDAAGSSMLRKVTAYLSDSSSYYLVESDSKQLLVNISEDFILSRELANKVDPKKFDFGNYTYRKATYQLI